VAVKQGATSTVTHRRLGETVRVTDCVGRESLPEGLANGALAFIVGFEAEHFAVFHNGREFKVPTPCVRNWDR